MYIGPMRTSALVFIGLALLAAAPSKGSAPDCPPKSPRTHCVYLSLKKSTRNEAEKIAKLLKTDGAEASISEDNDLTSMLSDAQLRKLLGAKVVYNSTGASASDVLVCEASIESIKPPTRYQNVESARIDSACP